MRRKRNSGIGASGPTAVPKFVTQVPNKVAHLKKSTGNQNPVSDSRAPAMLQKSVKGRRVSERLAQKKGVGAEVGIGDKDVELRKRLVEKLGFSEEKVERIGVEIREVKEMLDLSDEHLSKMGVSELEKRILGIEKALGCVGEENELNCGDGDGKRVVEEGRWGRVGLVRGKDDKVCTLDKEELEKRLFPHQRLMRERMAMRPGGDSYGGSVTRIVGDGGAEGGLEESARVEVKSEDDVGMGICEEQDMDLGGSLELRDFSNAFSGKNLEDVNLPAGETLDENENQENQQTLATDEQINDDDNQMHQIGHKTSTGGWFVSEGELVLLTHDDGSCSFYDLPNCEEKAEYKPPTGLPACVWKDCWTLRVAGADGCLGKYVVAASAGNSSRSGFCSWEFYSKAVHACHVEDEITISRTLLGASNRQNRTHVNSARRWYKPCGPLMVSAASSKQMVKVYDIRDGEEIMKFQAQKPVSTMRYTSPLQWRDGGKMVLAEAESISLWDMNSLQPKSLLSVSSSGQKVSAIHIANTDAGMSCGVRKRVSQTEAIGHDGIFCTADSISLLDFRHPSGVGLKIPITGLDAASVFSHGDCVLVGANSRQAAEKRFSSVVQQFSLRKRSLVTTYSMPETTTDSSMNTITQVWGNANLVMAVSSLGLTVYDISRDGTFQFSGSQGEVMGPDDMCSPSFDYALSRALVISRDRPAVWRDLILTTLKN